MLRTFCIKECGGLITSTTHGKIAGATLALHHSSKMTKSLRFAGLALILLAFACLAVYFFNGSAEPRLETVTTKMSEQDVKARFGRPDNVVLLPSVLYDAKEKICRVSAIRALVYYRKRKQNIVIYLDRRDRVTCAEERLVF